MTTKFETYINLEDFKKKYLLDFSEDDRYDDFILYLKDLREYLHEFAYHIIEGKYDYFTDNSGLDFDDVVSVIIPNKTLLNVYLQKDEFNDIDFLDLDSQRFNIVGQNHDVLYTFWHLNLLDMVEYIDNEILKISIIGGDVIKMTQKQSTQTTTNQEITVYESLTDFRKEYESDFSGLKDISLLQYLNKLKEKYQNHINKIEKLESDEIEMLLSKYNDFYEIYLSKITHLSYQFENFLDTDIDLQISENGGLNFNFDPYYVLEHSALINNDGNANLLKKYAEIYLQKIQINNRYELKKKPFENILDFIINLIENERIFVLRGTQTSITKDGLENEPLTTKQVQKIGLLIRSGIVDFIKEKNPKITTNQIAGFIDLVSKEPLKKTSINPYLGIENKHYAIKNQQDIDDLDSILKKFGISPQS